MFRFFRRATAPEPSTRSGAVEADSASQAVSQPDSGSGSDTPATSPTISDSLSKTRGGFFGAVRSLFRTKVSLDEGFWDDLEERLIAADLGAHVTADLINALRAQNARRPFGSGDDAEDALRERLHAILSMSGDTGLRLPVEGTAIILVIGVNGTVNAPSGRIAPVSRCSRNRRAVTLRRSFTMASALHLRATPTRSSLTLTVGYTPRSTSWLS